MNTLAFDTCFGACSVAATWRVPSAGVAGASRFERLVRGHAERLLPMIAEAMAEAPFDFAGLERIVVTTGPGTFTGQRIGIAAARALALATDAPVASLSSLAVMAHAAAAELGAEVAGKGLAVAVDARRGEIYFQQFAAPDWAPLAEPSLTTPEAAARLLDSSGMVAVGSGAEALAASARLLGVPVAARLGGLEPDVRFIPEAAMVPSQIPPRPLYLRPPDAKPQGGTLAGGVP